MKFLFNKNQNTKKFSTNKSRPNPQSHKLIPSLFRTHSALQKNFNDLIFASYVNIARL